MTETVPNPHIPALPIERKLVSVVIPCLDEAGCIEECVRRTQEALAGAGLAGEVIVADNGSEDDSPALALNAGAYVVHEFRQGYGCALMAGFLAARGEYLVMLDGDMTYPFEQIPAFVDELDKGADLVIGDRFEDLDPKVMPWANRHIGNPLFTALLNAFLATGVKDTQCGMRAIRASALRQLGLQTPGMEFASEMLINAARADLHVVEIPITYHRRHGDPKLEPVRDGWRHILHMLAHSPTQRFMRAGVALLLVSGLVFVVAALVPQTLDLGRGWRTVAQMAAAVGSVVAFQIVTFGLCAYVHANDRARWLDAPKTRFRLEHALMLGAAAAALGFLALLGVAISWSHSATSAGEHARLAALFTAIFLIGLQILFSAFLVAIISLRRRHA
jgi:hypothetical protein